MPGQVPCSVNMLTFNSERTLDAALASVADFAEIIVGDGGSTDATREIAGRYGARVVDQDRRFIDERGKLRDYGGARSQLIGSSRFEWILYIDSDEVLTPEAVTAIAREIAAPSRSDIGAYLLPGKHLLKGRIIEDEMSSVAEVRLFRRSAVSGIKGMVNESPELLPGFTTDRLDAVFLREMPTMRHLVPKWLRYLPIIAREADANGPGWTKDRLAFHRSAVRWLLRDWVAARRRGRTPRMPLRYEALRVVFAVTQYLALLGVRLRQLARPTFRGRGSGS